MIPFDPGPDVGRYDQRHMRLKTRRGKLSLSEEGARQVISIIDLRGIDPRFRSGLVFSAFEGLLLGRQLQFLSDAQPASWESAFVSARLASLKWYVDPVEPGLWRITLTKI